MTHENGQLVTRRPAGRVATSVLNGFLGDLLQESGSDLIERKPVKIGKGCFIGGLVVIMPGVTIGDFATVQPNSVVAKDVPSRTLVAGNPARVFQRYDQEWIEGEAARVRAENAARRDAAAKRGIQTTWGAPPAFDES